MKKARNKSILHIIILLLLFAGGVYMLVAGVGKEKTGKVTDIPLGLDLNGGLSVTYEIKTPDPTSEEIAATIDKLQRRVDEYNPEGEVYQEGDDRITVEIPKPSGSSDFDAREILAELGQPGSLEFLDEENYEKYANGEEYEYALNGSDVKNATAGVDDSGTIKDYVVALQFTDEGTKKFADITTANVDKIVYIMYDGGIASAPRVNEPITGGNAEINSIGSYEEAEKLASTIKIGALPLEIEQLQYNIVGAKLGQDAISTSLKAGAIGLGIVCILMIIIYLVPGVIASIALIAYVLLMLLVLSINGTTLTLPGLAGIVLSIGMAVDANVIIFTRIKEEIAENKGVKAAVESGFSKALSAILDGNITTLIAAFVLALLGTGSIKGFASTLVIGIILSMFTALVVTKMLLNAAVNFGITSEKAYGRAKAPKIIGYVKNSKICFVISALAIIAGLVFLPINKAKTGNILNYSLEFTGGTSTTVTFDEAYTLERAETEVAPVIAEATGVSQGSIQIQVVEDSNQVIFKTTELSEEAAANMEEAIKSAFSVSEITG